MDHGSGGGGLLFGLFLSALVHRAPSLAALILASSFLDASARRRLRLAGQPRLFLQRIETIGRRGQLSRAKKNL